MVGTVSYDVRLGGSTEAEALLTELRKAFPRLVIQLLSLPDKPSSNRIRMIASQTVRSQKMGDLLAGKPEVDLLLRMAGTTQISRAISSVGYQRSGSRLIVAIGARGDIRELEYRAVQNPERYTKTAGRRLTNSDLEAIERAALLNAVRS